MASCRRQVSRSSSRRRGRPRTSAGRCCRSRDGRTRGCRRGSRGTGCREEPVGTFDARPAVEARGLVQGVEMRRQAFNLLDIENRVALEIRNGALDVGACECYLIVRPPNECFTNRGFRRWLGCVPPPAAARDSRNGARWRSGEQLAVGARAQTSPLGGRMRNRVRPQRNRPPSLERVRLLRLDGEIAASRLSAVSC